MLKAQALVAWIEIFPSLRCLVSFSLAVQPHCQLQSKVDDCLRSVLPKDVAEGIKGVETCDFVFSLGLDKALSGVMNVDQRLLWHHSRIRGVLFLRSRRLLRWNILSSFIDSCFRFLLYFFFIG